MQIKVSKSNAIGRLSELNSAVAGLRFSDQNSRSFMKWRLAVMGALKYIFGGESEELASFRSIGFETGSAIPSPRELRQAYLRGLQNSQMLIESLVEQVELYWDDDANSTRSDAAGEGDGMNLSNQVFVVHGRDQGALAEVKLVLTRLELEPVVLQDLPNQGRTIIEKFEDYANVGFAVVVCTPDDDGKLAAGDTGPQPRARQNVVCEWGYFLGKLGRNRVCALIKGDVEVPSDYSGVLYVRIDDNEGWKVRLVRELNEAGYRVDLNKLV